MHHEHYFERQPNTSLFSDAEMIQSRLSSTRVPKIKSSIQPHQRNYLQNISQIQVSICKRFQSHILPNLPP